MELLSNKGMSRQGTLSTFESQPHFPSSLLSPAVRLSKLVDGPYWCERQDGSVSTSHPCADLTSQRAVNVHYCHSTRIAEAVDAGDNSWPAQTLFCLHLSLAWTCQRTAKLDVVRNRILGQLSYNSPHLLIITPNFTQFSAFLISSARNYRCWSWGYNRSSMASELADVWHLWTFPHRLLQMYRFGEVILW